jgi:sulfate permease, SulP family
VRERLPDDPRASSLLIYDLEGEAFFGAAPELHRYFSGILEETSRTAIKYVVLRLRRVRNPDAVAVEELDHFLHDAEKQGVTVLLAGLRPDFVKILGNVGLTGWFPADHIFPEEDKIFSATLRAVRYAYRLIHEKAAAEGTNTDHSSLRQSEEAAYYLV